jgi:hypothetical protein
MRAVRVIEFDTAALLHTSSFAQAVACPEVLRHLDHLALPSGVAERLPQLARSFLISRGEILPCLHAQADDSHESRTLSAGELEELAALAAAYLPGHHDSVQKFLWLQEIFIPFDTVTAAQPLRIPSQKAAELRSFVTAFDTVLDPIDGPLDGLEAHWLQAYGLEDRRPYSTLYESISWRYYKDLWRKIRDLLAEDELGDFLQWARSVSTHNRKYGELEPPSPVLEV